MYVTFGKLKNAYPTFTPIQIQYFSFESSNNRILDIHTSWGKWDFMLSFYWQIKQNRLINNVN